MKKTLCWGVVQGLGQELSGFLGGELKRVLSLLLVPAKPIYWLKHGRELPLDKKEQSTQSRRAFKAF
jgi:hypothetical protein